MSSMFFSHHTTKSAWRQGFCPLQNEEFVIEYAIEIYRKKNPPMAPQKTLVQKSLPVQILLFSLPLMVSNVLQVLFNMADIAVVGRFSGSLSLAAVGSTTTAVALFTGILIGLGGGVNALVARHYGARDKEGLGKTIHSSLLICLFCGLIMTAFGLVGSRTLLKLLNTKPELLDKASLYMGIYFCGMPALALYNFGNAVYSAIGDTKKPLIFLLISGILNVVLNLFFVIVCHLDVAGVAIASILSQYLSAFLILFTLFRSKEIFGLRLKELRLTGKNAREILTLGIPSGIQNGIFYAANLFIQMGVNSFDTIMVAGNSAAANADGLVFDVMTAFYTACSSFIGLNYGAGDMKKVKKSYHICMSFSFGIGMAMGLSLVFFGPTFLSLFTSDPAVVAAGMKRLTIMGICYGFSAFMDNAIAGCRGLGKSFWPMVMVIIGSVIFRIIWVYTVFAYFHTILSLYLLYIFSWAITAVFENWYFIKTYRSITASH